MAFLILRMHVPAPISAMLTTELAIETGVTAMNHLLLADDVGKSAVPVTHDERVLPLCDRALYLENGRLIEKLNRMAASYKR